MESLTPQQFVAFCEEIYTTQNNERRKELMRTLPTVLPNPSSLPYYFNILTQTNNVYAAQYIISLILNSFKTDPNSFLSSSNEIQTVLLKVVQNPQTPPFIMRASYNLFSITVVYSWKDPSTHGSFVSTIQALLQSSNTMLVSIAVQLIFSVLDGAQTNFSKMNLEKNQISTIKTTIIFELMNYLITLFKSIQLIPSNEEIVKTIINSLNSGINLCHSWHYDEADPSWIHLPEKIYAIIQDQSFYQKLSETYSSFANTKTSSFVLELFFVLASLRQLNVPGAMNKQNIVQILSSFIQAVIENETGFQTNDNFVSICRFLMKFRTTQLTGSTTNTEWLKSVARFTIKVFKCNNIVCINNMLNFWMKHTMSMFRCPDKAQEWNVLINEVSQMFVQSMIEKEEYYFQNDPSEDPLLNEEQLQLIYDSYGPVARYSYDSFHRIVKSLLTNAAQQFGVLCSAPMNDVNFNKKNLLAGQIAWIIELVVSVLKAKLIMATDTITISLDASISNIVFPFVIQYNRYVQSSGLMKNIKDMETSGDFRLQKACINFMTVFRTALVSKQTIGGLSEMHIDNVATAEDFLKFYIEMVGTVLSQWQHSIVIITKCLELFTIISSSSLFNYQLFKFGLVRQLVTQDHTSLLSQFQGTPSQIKKIHFELYKTLGSILFNCRLSVHLPQFLRLFVPIVQQIQHFIESPNPNFNNTIIYTLFIDLRSITISANCCDVVPMCLYDFLIVHVFPLVPPLLTLFQRSPILLIPLLRLLGDIASSKNFQENFPIESPNCMTIFKNIATATATLCRTFLQNPNRSFQNPYLECFKPICLCLKAMSECFKCNLVNFSVFQMYQDTSVVETLNSTLETALQIPFSALEEYPKIVKGVYLFVDSLSLICTANIRLFNEQDIFRLLKLVLNGMKMKNGEIILNCSHFLQSLLSVFYLTPNRNLLGIDNIIQLCSTHFESILWTCFDNILNDFDIWALSRPILLIFLLSPPSFDGLMLTLVKQIKSSPKQQSFLSYSSSLKNSIDPIYNDVTQELFEENLRQFVKCVKPLFD